MQTSNNIVVELKLTRERAFACVVFLFLVWRPAIVGSETIQMTTYYPAPYGGYVSLMSTQSSYLARDSGGLTVGSSAAPTTKLDVRNGGISMDAFQTFSARGRMHIDGTEMLYLLNDSGVTVSRAWGGTGDLIVEGRLRGLCTRVNYNYGNTTNCPGNKPYVVGQYNNSNYWDMRPYPDDAIWGSGSDWRLMAEWYANGDVTAWRVGQGWWGHMICCNFEI